LPAWQTATRESVAAIKEIGGTIGRDLRDFPPPSSAAAVEEQGAATQEIARNVSQGRQGHRPGSPANITEVNRGASETGFRLVRGPWTVRAIALERKQSSSRPKCANSSTRSAPLKGSGGWTGGSGAFFAGAALTLRQCAFIPPGLDGIGGSPPQLPSSHDRASHPYFSD